jgi:hypothetical protein
MAEGEKKIKTRKYRLQIGGHVFEKKFGDLCEEFRVELTELAERYPIYYINRQSPESNLMSVAEMFLILGMPRIIHIYIFRFFLVPIFSYSWKSECRSSRWRNEPIPKRDQTI